MAKKKRNRVAYDMPEELQEALNSMSDELGVPPGQILTLFGLEGIERFEQGEINIDDYKEAHPRSLKYPFRLNLDEKINRLKGKK